MGFQCYFSLNFRLKVVERSHNKRHNAFSSQAMRYHYDIQCEMVTQWV